MIDNLHDSDRDDDTTDASIHTSPASSNHTATAKNTEKVFLFLSLCAHMPTRTAFHHSRPSRSKLPQYHICACHAPDQHRDGVQVPFL